MQNKPGKCTPTDQPWAGFSAECLNLELRYWTNQSVDWPQIKSEVALVIRAKLSERGVAVK